MDDFYEYLAQVSPKTIPFSNIEISEPLLTVYFLIKKAIDENCTIITIHKNMINLTEKIDGESKGKLTTRHDFKPEFVKIMNRDKIVSQHLKIIKETENCTIVKISITT